MKIEVLGKGCSKCEALERHAREAVTVLGLNAEVSHVYDLNEIIRRGVFVTPAVMVDGKIVFAGRVGTVDELKEILLKAK